MLNISGSDITRHIHTYTGNATIDQNAIDTLSRYLRTKDGKLFHNFEYGGSRPNIDGELELVPDPEAIRSPKRRFCVQIKGTNHAACLTDESISYQLKNLAFPAYIAREVTLDPGILFVVLNPGTRSKERVFWKYMSYEFLASLDFSKNSTILHFTNEYELFDTDKSIDDFVKKLDEIAERHSFIKQLEIREYSQNDVRKIVLKRSQSICEAIEMGHVLNKTRDNVSQKILTELEDLCKATLILNCYHYQKSFCKTISIRTAWECALINIDTKFLSTFLEGLRYVGMKVPEEGQSERLMLKYYHFLWRIREYLSENFGINVLDNLESFPLEINSEDAQYNKVIADAVNATIFNSSPIKSSRYYIQKKSPFFVGKERYFEITLQLADKYATKFNRITTYTKLDISTNYSIQIACEDVCVALWDAPSYIKVITNWKVSIEPSVLNKLSKILKKETMISSRQGEYMALMDYLTQTGLNLVDFIDMRDTGFYTQLGLIYGQQRKCEYRNILDYLHSSFNNASLVFGRNTVRYVLLRLREDIIDSIIPAKDDSRVWKEKNLNISVSCYPFERNPAIYNLPNKKTNGNFVSKDVLRIAGRKIIGVNLPFIRIRHMIDNSGEIVFPKEMIEPEGSENTIAKYNASLTDWDIEHGLKICEKNGYVYIEEYERDTIYILKKLEEYTNTGNEGQENLNLRFVEAIDKDVIDVSKKVALKSVFVNSKAIIIYGAAGTGKTTMMNYISNLMAGRSKLFLSKTHTALENLKRRIEAPGQASTFVVIDRFLGLNMPSDYEIIFIDECSTIDNRTMKKLLKKLNKLSLLVLAGDIYQIESIDFGNWFFYAKDILPSKSIFELTSTWRTQEEKLKSLWEEVRHKKPLITEKLVIDGPFSENIGKTLFIRNSEDEVVLCLNYDGKFGLNNINSYFQDANPSIKTFFWYEWKYKIGDPILFNESKRFPKLYNNLKGQIVDIQQDENSITFTIDVDILLTALDVRNRDMDILQTNEKTTRIRFSVYANRGGTTDEEREISRMNSIVPFQLAYAVSIHKAQGLEYDSIKVVIPNSNSERISHGVFYTAITRAKEQLKIYWSAETMEKVVSSFSDYKSAKNDSSSLLFIKERMLESAT